MIALSWEQVNAWRLSQHHLHELADRQQFREVVSNIGGLHAQMMSAAELQLWARVHDLPPDAVQNALWHERTLIKSWIFRGTLHLVTASDFPLFVAALSRLGAFYRRPSWLKYNGVTLAELEALVEGVRTTLGNVGMSREELANALATSVGNPKVRDRLLSGWGVLLKPAAIQGYLCFGPSEGQNVMFVQPEKWLGTWSPVEPDTALAEVAHRYINAYGPATIDDFAHWLGIDPSKAKRIFKSLADEIVEVDVEGWQAWALTTSISQIEALKPSRTVRLLPNFDPYTLALSRHCQYVLSAEFKGRVYRPQGWISPVVLVDGRMSGVWEYEKKRSQVAVKIDMFASPTGEVKSSIKAEAERLGAFFDAKVRLSFA